MQVRINVPVACTIVFNWPDQQEDRVTSYFCWTWACVISAGCIKSDTDLQQIDPPSSRHEITVMACAQKGMCGCMCSASAVTWKDFHSLCVYAYVHACIPLPPIPVLIMPVLFQLAEWSFRKCSSTECFLNNHIWCCRYCYSGSFLHV